MPSVESPQTGHPRVVVAAIDQMAWLMDEKDMVRNDGFTVWVQRYMLDKKPQLLSSASASDLWGARWGVLHPGASESNWSRSSRARRVYYSSNMGQIAVAEQDVLVLSIE